MTFEDSNGADYKLLAVYIEDSVSLRNAVRDYLRMMDIEVKVTGSVRVGQDLILKYQPHIILLDLNLPDGSGIALCRKLRGHSHTSHIPIIIFSADDDEITRQQAHAAGAHAFHNKEQGLDILAASIQSTLDELKKLPSISDEDSTKFSTGTYASIGRWYGKPPQEILPVLAAISRQSWNNAILNILKQGKTTARGQAVIALAAWQKEPDAPYNLTRGQRFFWEHVRHSLASGTSEDAERTWGELSPIALSLTYPPQRIRAALEHYALNHRNAECRSWSLRILLENQDPAVADYAVEAMSDLRGGVRLMAALILTELGEPQHIPILTKALNDKPGVREQAAAALARIDSPLSTVALSAALNQGTPQAAEAAANGLATKASPEAVTALVQAADTRKESGVLAQIAHALGKVINDTSRQTLTRLAAHPDETVRRAAQQYL